MTASLPEGTIKLRDGRRLAYAEYGDPHGKPIFFFHGTPGSRLFHHPDTSIAASSGARIIAVDRPGIGHSDFKPGRTLLDWPSDVVQLADALRIDRFAVMGYSGGGPYAAVCASSIPDRLTVAGLVSSVAPMDNPDITRGMHGIGHTYFSLERHLPPLAKFGCWLLCTTWRHNPDLYFKAQLNGLHDSKEAQTTVSTLKPMLTADFQEAVRTGTEGIAWDLEILTRPWGFQLHVTTVDVFLWHGENDTQAPLAMGKRLAGAIPHCRATFYPGEGHWAIYNHWHEILTALAGAEVSARPEPEPTVAAIASEDARSVTPAAVFLNVDSAYTPADPFQGLQPTRQESEITVTATPDDSTVAQAGMSALEPEPVKKASKPVSKKTAKRAAAAVAKPAAVVAPEPLKESPKPVSKKTSKRAAAAVAEPAAVVAPEPLEEAPKPVSKKTARRAVAAETPVVTPEPEPMQEASKPVSAKTAKRAAMPSSNRLPDKTAELPEKPKTTAKKTVKPKAAAIEPPPPAVARKSATLEEPAEATPVKPSSRRKAAKEAALV